MNNKVLHSLGPQTLTVYPVIRRDVNAEDRKEGLGLQILKTAVVS